MSSQSFRTLSPMEPMESSICARAAVMVFSSPLAPACPLTATSYLALTSSSSFWTVFTLVAGLAAECVHKLMSGYCIVCFGKARFYESRLYIPIGIIYDGHQGHACRPTW